LREEIVESEKARAELLKWKLIAVSALGAAGLGLTESQNATGAHLVLPLIPPVCVYIDLLCRHMSLRILVIAAFMRSSRSGEGGDYERFIKKIAPEEGRKVFSLEDFALEWSTLLLSFIFGLVGAMSLWLPEVKGQLDGQGMDMSMFSIFSIVSGLAGIVSTLWVKHVFRRYSRNLDGIKESDPRFADLGLKSAGELPKSAPLSEAE
jgi:hypothetical protein